jgi:hypothetical protein
MLRITVGIRKIASYKEATLEPGLSCRPDRRKMAPYLKQLHHTRLAMIRG